MTYTVSYDEKTGIQAISNKYPDHNSTKKMVLSVGIMNICVGEQ